MRRHRAFYWNVACFSYGKVWQFAVMVFGLRFCFSPSWHGDFLLALDFILCLLISSENTKNSAAFSCFSSLRISAGSPLTAFDLFWLDQHVLLGAVPFPSDVLRLKELGVCGVVTLNESYERLVPRSLYEVSILQLTGRVHPIILFCSHFFLVIYWLFGGL